MTRTPTAEEVLAKYREWQEAESQWSDSEDERFNLATAAMVARDSFEYAYDQWQAAQGPVTREWFVERFGASEIDQSIHGWTMHISLRGTVEIGLHDEYGEVYLELDNPTRERIEALVEMLGGAACT